MKQIISILLLSALAIFPVTAESEENKPLVLSVDMAVRLGLENNYNLKVQENKLGSKARSKEDAWNVFLPDVSASATLSRSNEPTTLSSGSYSIELNPWTAVGNISAQLALSPAMFNGVKQLELDYNNALLDLEAAEQSTEKSIKTNFYNLLLLKEQIDVLKKNIGTTETRLKSMEEMYNYGYITELDLLNTKAALSSLGPTLLKMENGFEQLKMVFLMDLGLSLDREIFLDGSVEALPEIWNADELINTHMANRIDVQQLTVAEDMLSNAKSATFNQGLLPTLVLGWSYSPYQVDPFESETWGDDSYSGDNGAFSVTLSMPVENWIPHSGTSNDIKDAQDEIDRMAYQKELALLGAEMEIRSLVMTLNTSRKSLEVLSESIEINQRSLEMSTESYNSGQLSLLDLETAENDLLQSELDLVSEKYNYISSLLSLEAAINHNLTK
jgi:multidrug efflux system outer membrane protein